MNTAKTVTVTVTEDRGALAVRCPFDQDWLDELSAEVPSAMRRWDRAAKVWLVAPQYGPLLAALCSKHFGATVRLPAVRPVGYEERFAAIQLEYVAAPKNGYANGWADNDWSVVFPESVLMEWFGAEKRTDGTLNFYQTMGLRRDATVDELKSMWRKLARQWHPDVNRDPDAAAVFRSIRQAYDVLSDGQKRARYDAGLAFQALARVGEKVAQPQLRPWSPPLRCGNLLIKYHDYLGRKHVDNIMTWFDLTDEHGRVAVSIWQPGAKMFTMEWGQG